jgi:hypothetical protein
MVRRKAETFEPVTLGHIRFHGCRDLLVYCDSGRCHHGERELILARTSDGRDRAKARGVRFGRPPALTAHQRQEAIKRLQEGQAQAEVARSYNVSQATISRLEPSPFEGASVAAV